MHELQVQFSNDEFMARYAPENEQYMVLYNGNAEVVGNFRALNFYKASDINIKEDVRLLIEDRDPRNVLLKIDGVEYKFKKGTSHSTNKRFVGYIAQQIESVVPEAVQLIDGILHVDYESLIPYLSESIKQNYSDINDTKTEQQRINAIVDVLYNDFLKRERAEKPSTSKHDSSSSERFEIRTTNNTWRRVSIAALGVLLVVSAVLVGLYVMTGRNQPLNDTPSPSPEINPSSTPTAPEGTTPPAPHSDRQVLEDFYVAMDGSNWKIRPWDWDRRWLTNTSFCNWVGLVCEQGRVKFINLAGYNLRGTIPDSISDLDALEFLNLSGNSITGTIPESISKLRNLRELSIAKNNVTGVIPAIQQLNNLMTLDLESNPYLSGSIPNLPTSLTRILLAECNLTGTIPRSISNMDLKELRMESNQLSGTIPPVPIGDELLVINLSDNQLEGTLPAFTKRSGLFPVYLAAANNYLSGTLENLAGIRIEKLLLQNNNFSGEVAYFDTSNVDTLALNNNKFTSFNISAPRPTNSNYICDASGNPFRCPIPAWVEQRCNATCIQA